MSRVDLQAQIVAPLYRVADKCRLCASADLQTYLDLGLTPPADQFRTAAELATLPEIFFPLRVNVCRACGLSQLSHVVRPEVLYQHDYPYESSITQSGWEHWRQFAAAVVNRLNLQATDTVVDVGSNTGTLLRAFHEFGPRVLGVDPAANIVAGANAAGIETICAFFEKEGAAVVRARVGRVAVITGTNVFAHIDDLSALLQAVSETLHERGVFVFESPHVQHLLQNLEYDTIYHEHLSYLSLRPIVSFVPRFGLEVFAVEKSDIHGGSFRVYIGRVGQHSVDDSVPALLAEEQAAGVHDPAALLNFAARVAANKSALVNLVENLLQQGKKVVAVSAPAKGMTLLNYCGLTARQIQFVTEKSKLKIGRFTPGGHIPVVADTELVGARPDYALLLAWNFAPEIQRNLQFFTEQGGKFIIPIPTPTIV